MSGYYKRYDPAGGGSTMATSYRHDLAYSGYDLEGTDERDLLSSRPNGYSGHTMPVVSRAARSKRFAASLFSPKQLVIMLVPSCFALIITCCSFVFVYRYVPHLVWFLVVLSFLGALVQARRTVSLYGYIANSCMWLILPCGIALGAIAGYSIYDLVVGRYWYYNDGRAYSNVLPLELAAGYSDARMLAFADEARVDATRSVGFKDGALYCVAPILGDVDVHSDAVQFWAVGVDCCGARGRFSCGDAWDPRAKAGLVARYRCLLRSDRHEQYEQAVKQAEAAMGIVSAKDPILVEWVVDPKEVTLNLWRSGLAAFGITCGVALLLPLLGACVISLVAKSVQ